MCSRCYFCEQDVETIDHLFLHCKVVSQLWNLFTSFRGIRWAMRGRTGEALTSWNFEGGGSTNKDMWRIVPAVIWWTIWKDRNSRCSEGSSFFCYWCSSEYIDDPVSIVDVVESL
ncbi:unnamed protein product [Withania somnifera]